MNIRNLSALIITSLTLTACGGGGPDSGDPTTPSNPNSPTTGTKLAQGRAIDGYINGATAFYDFNNNGQLDDDEVSAITGEGGKFEFVLEEGEKLTEEQTRCMPYAPIIIDVPVGAIDEELGEVTHAYRLTTPPQHFVGQDSVYNVTPITSVLWTSAAQAVQQQMGSPYTCQLMLDNPGLAHTIDESIRRTTGEFVFRFNMSADVLYDDYIASGNTAVGGIAQMLVKGLKLAQAETFKLLQAHPNAWVTVGYYPTDDRDDYSDRSSWYYSVVVDDGKTRDEEVWRVNANFERVALLTDLVETTTTVAGASGGTTTVSTAYEYSDRNSNTDTERCNVTETLLYTTTGGTRYTMRNNVTLDDQGLDACRNSQVTDHGLTSTSLEVGHRSAVDKHTGFDISYGFVGNFNPEVGDYEPHARAHLFGVSLDPTNYDYDSWLTELKALPTSASEAGTVDAKSWTHTKRYMEGTSSVWEVTSSEPMVVPGLSFTPTHFRSLSHEDGTREYQCDKGGDWVSCS